MAYEPRRVLDAGCGTGRVAIELANRGVRVVGVDLDRAMLEAAVEKAPHIEWFRADLATLSVPHPTKPDHQRLFDTVVAAGNVMIFVQPGSEALVVERMASHLAPGGVLISGFQLRPGGYTVDMYDAHCAAAGLVGEERYSSWSRDPWNLAAGYAVLVHRKPLPDPAPEEKGKGKKSKQAPTSETTPADAAAGESSTEPVETATADTTENANEPTA